jgi:hypothetical protein
MTTKAIQRRYLRIYELGCICCRSRGWFSPCQIHHLNLGQHAGQKRIGDEASIGLCPYHHVGQIDRAISPEALRLLGPSLALEPVKFRKVFGSDQELLAKQNELIAEKESMVIGRTA